MSRLLRVWFIGGLLIAATQVYAEVSHELKLQRTLVLPELNVPRRDVQTDFKPRTEQPVQEQLRLQRDVMQQSEALHAKPLDTNNDTLLRAGMPVRTVQPTILEMSKMLDQLDRQEFRMFLERASDCARQRDLQCAEANLVNARKLANTQQEMYVLKRTEDFVASRKRW